MIHAETLTLMTVLLRMVWVFQSLSEDAGDAVGGGNFGLLVIMTNKREKKFLNMTLLNPLHLSSLCVFSFDPHYFISFSRHSTDSVTTNLQCNKVKITSGNIPPNATHLKDRNLYG